MVRRARARHHGGVPITHISLFSRRVRTLEGWAAMRELAEYTISVMLVTAAICFVYWIVSLAH
jgi:hypothetical protein